VNDLWPRIAATIAHEFSDLGGVEGFTRVSLRLLMAALLGAAIGYERERRQKAAGLRTHMLVAIGSALFVMVPQLSGMEPDAISRVLQGLIAGIGFLGAGAVLKQADEGQIRGLTTAATIWATAAIGAAAGLGRESTAILGTLAVLVVLVVLLQWERRVEAAARADGEGDDSA
jgi:putative Mg2+ transporter-C (MgtC) family protein